MGRRRFLGVDFSGAEDPRKKIWVAEVRAEGDGWRLADLRNGFTRRDLVDHLLAAGRSGARGCALLDFPFGLSALTAKNLGVASPEPEDLWRKVAACGAPRAFRSRGRGGVTGRGSETPHKRHVDRLCHTPFAAVNLRLHRQTFRGMAEVLLPLKEGGASIAPWTFGDFWIGEGCPSSVLRRRFGGRPTGYKRNEREAQPGKERARRRQLLDGVRGELGIRLTRKGKALILDDPEGDALDAFVLAAAAAAVTETEIAASRDHVRRHPTEAWVYRGN